MSGGTGDVNDEPMAPAPGAEIPVRPSDGLSLADLRDAVRLRKDLTRLEDENRFMREQLGHAMSGWRDEQRRTREMEQTMKALPAPAPDGEPEAEWSPVGTPARPAGDPPPPSEAPGFWARLWQSLSD